ncbi:hypothetical protein KFK09_025976 [Dendrobium nobile]|uniref:DFDF domain-containing protein n=1 Tax=Dendrobium nobile TaxID=94219 RepID=A0A8T3A5B5_DENNO|nr:hypothetical protein KFK09_025976 [Dendrobium nobile]
MAAEASTSEPSEDPVIGSLVSLISKDGIRYEGIIYYLNPEGPSIGLRNVRSFGTEGRKKDGLQVPPSQKVFDLLIFHGSDIEDVSVKFLPPVIGAPVRDDPAIVQSHYSPLGPASTAGSGSISDQSSQAVQPAHPRSIFQDGLPLYQAGKNIESWGSTLPVASCSELGIPMNLQEFYEPTSGLSHLPQKPLFPAPPVLSIPHSLPQPAQFSNINSLFLTGTLGFHEAACPLPPLVSSTSTSVSTSMQHPTINSLFKTTTPSFPKFIPPLEPPVSYTPNLISTSLPATVAPTQASLLDIKRLLSLHPNISLVNSHPDSVFGINFPVVPPLGYSNAPGTSVPENNNSIRSSPSNESPSLPFRMISQSMPSSTSFFSSIQGDTLLPSATPDQLQHPSNSMLPSSLLVQAIHEDAKFKSQEPQSQPLTCELPPPATAMKEPLLPMLPPGRPNEAASYANYYNRSQSHGRGRGNAFSEPVTSFSEDFDFNAMNEKFNKAEIWGLLGKGQALVKSDDRGQSSNVNVIQEEENSLNLKIQPAYSKDDFFDTLFSYTSKPRRPSGRTRVPEQLNVNLEAFDDFRTRSNRGGGRHFRRGSGGRWRG